MKKLPFLSLAISFLLFWAIPCFAQNQFAKNEDYLIEPFELPDGPSGNSINCIVQGANGFLWLGGHSGLYRYDGYHIKSYKSVQGDSTSLAFSYIEWLFWSSDNYLWIGTYGGGLFRFNPDDESFIRYHHDPNDPSSLSDDLVTSIVEENKEFLWIGTTHGLNRLDRSTGKFERYMHVPNDPTSLSFDDVRALYIDRAGTLWVGTGFVYQDDATKGGLNRFNPETKTFTRYFHNSGDPTSLMGNLIKSIYEDSKGNFWVGGTGGLHKMDRQKGTFQRMLDDPKVAGDIFAPGFIDNEISSAFSLLEDSSQQLWIFSLHWPQSGTLGSIAKVDLRTNKMEIIRERAAIVPWQTIQCADGSIWIAGAGVGGKVHKIRPGNTQIKYLPFVMNDGGVNKGVSFEGLAAQNDSIVWGKTSSADGTPQIIGITNDFRVWGVRELPEVKKIDTSLIGFNKIMGLEGVGMVIDQRGLLWGCTGFHNGGLFSIAPNEAGVHQYLHDPNNPNSPLENDIRYLMTDRKGIIWLANRHSVSCFDPVNELFTHYKHDPNDSTSLSYTEVFTLFEDRDGYIWIGGMEFNGLPTLDRLDPSTGKIIRTEIPLNYQGGWINNISQSKQGDIYFLIKNKILAVIFYEQISRENVSETWHSFMDTTFQNANNLIADDQGIFWLTTNDGKILRLDPETQSLIEFQDRPGLEFKQRRSFKLPDGTIYFPYQEGLVAINPLDKVPDQLHFQPTKVRFTEFFLNGQSVAIKGQTILDRPIWQTSQLNLSYQQSNFGLRFSAFDLKKPENSQYEVRLLPNESTWRRIEGEPVINYYQLPPGNYTLEVKGSDSYGIWAQEIASMNIHISPPWWKSWWAYLCYGLLMLFIIFRFDRFQRQRIVERERQRTLERELEQSKEIKKAYAELKATQSQLIQSEKMASLGELTAGIAHEIQNPLNFVNNFSEVNKELIAELKEEIEKGNLAEVKIIANDLTANEEKIHQHGKRADAIVKSMLQHSRTSTGEKELTDINALCDEYLRLAYHGMRARDKSFNADFKTKFDANLPKIKVIPQDIGRVLLNLINNAFQAAADVEKPEVVVSTEKHEDRIEIKVKDNGPGIPEHIKDKIFQPFFTTKPTGQGTGLGLSLAYDIVKAHGGK